jgi:hypothetical protein
MSLLLVLLDDEEVPMGELQRPALGNCASLLWGGWESNPHGVSTGGF